MKVNLLKKPEIPIVDYKIIKNNQIEFEITPPSEKGKPNFTSYIITWENKYLKSSSSPGEKNGRLLNSFIDSYYKNNVNINGEEVNLNVLTSEPYSETGNYIELPTQWLDEPNTKVTDNDKIKIIHKTDNDGNPLKYATKYNYKIYAVTKKSIF